MADELEARVHFEDSPEEARFRAELRNWLDEHASLRSDDDGPVGIFSAFVTEDEDDLVDRARAWQRRLADAGWAAVTWPEEYGGRGAGMLEAMVYAEELDRYDVPRGVLDIGITMVGPTLIAHADEEQKQRYLPPMRRGDEIWCQLWSEPDAGSDLAGLTARAEYDADADEFVLNGQKVWTSGAQYSQFGLGIFRSNPDVPKHRGITCLVVDMSAPGIEVRPLRQITGGAHFNEVFFDDVRVPAVNVVGEVDAGWGVAKTMMIHERMAASGMSPTDFLGPLIDLARSSSRGGATAAQDPLIRQRLADVYTRARIFDLTTARVRTAIAQGGFPGNEASVLKLGVAILGSDAADLALDILGADATTHGARASQDRWITSWLGAPAVHIGGGTDEIQRNVIGEQVLGLPREPATGKDVPFRELRTGTQR